MIICGIDFETTGLDPSIHAICEVGAQLWDTEYHRAIASMGYLVQIPPEATLDKEAEIVTGLSLEMITKYGKDSVKGLKQLLNMYDQADIICAHNGNSCDRIFLRAWMASCGITDEIFPEDKLWIDTLTDIEYPPKWNRQLISLAAQHGFLNPFPHQALSDVMTMLRILDCYPIDQVVETAKTPIIAVKLLNMTYDKKEWAKVHNFYPHRNKEGKFMFWTKSFKENKFQMELKEAVSAGFDLKQLDEIPKIN
jgi:DNA polymerase-3 subunit epsilon